MARKTLAKDAPPAIESWTGADAALAEVRVLEASIADRETEKARELTALQQRYDDDIVALKVRVGALDHALADFADFHRDELGDAKSRRLNHGTVGFRFDPPSLKTLARWTWKKVLAKVEDLGRGEFFRVKTSLNKEALLRAAGDMSTDELKALGVRVAQDERFYRDTTVPETVNPEAAP